MNEQIILAIFLSFAVGNLVSGEEICRTNKPQTIQKNHEMNCINKPVTLEGLYEITVSAVTNQDVTLSLYKISPGRREKIVDASKQDSNSTKTMHEIDKKKVHMKKGEYLKLFYEQGSSENITVSIGAYIVAIPAPSQIPSNTEALPPNNISASQPQLNDVLQAFLLLLYTFFFLISC